ncbi:MAG TPA: D-glycerate dehydrogenase [Deinococcales bacterium]|nr:D-glycerate dehydrogenase [Deinococcales bacterium]
MAKVFITRPLPEPGASLLSGAGHEVVVSQHDRPLSRDALLAGIADADAVLCLLSDRMDAVAMDAAPRLRVIANYAVGYDNIDVAAATERGIVVTNTPDVLTEATADIAWTLLLATARQAIVGDRLVRSGSWTGWAPRQLLGPSTTGKTLGILGMGRIGAAIGRRARGFSMRVIYHNRRRNPEAEAELGAEYVSLQELLERSDFLSLNSPLTPETRHLIDEAALHRMKPGAIIVNTGRGPLIDEGALVRALRERRIAGAGLDVFEREPQLEPGLAELDNVVILPHLGSATFEARAEMVRLCSENILAVLAGRPALTPLNPQAAGKRGG